MIVLSIDVGVRHLSLCIMRSLDKTDLKTYEILLWGVYNTLEDDTKLCVALQKDNKICNKVCKYQYEEQENKTVYCCKNHFPKTIAIEKKHTYKIKKIKDTPLQEVVKSVLIKLTDIYNKNKSIFDSVEQVLIELQPTFNPSMKLISHVIYGKLTEWCMDRPCKIKFVRASQKLKAYTDEPIECVLKGKYNQRKWLSKKYCSYFLENKFSGNQRDKWLAGFKEKGTADEGDTFLMCINCLYGVPKKKNYVSSVCIDDKTDFVATPTPEVVGCSIKD